MRVDDVASIVRQDRPSAPTVRPDRPRRQLKNQGGTMWVDDVANNIRQARPSAPTGPSGNSNGDRSGYIVCRKSGSRGLHSSTSELNLSRSWALKPQQASTSQLNLSLSL